MAVSSRRFRPSVCPLEDRLTPAGGTGTTTQQTPTQQTTTQQTATTQPTSTTTTTTATGPTFLPDRGVKPSVNVVTSTGTVSRTVSVYDTAFTGGVWVARADINGDGVPDDVVAPGAGTAPTVKIVSGSDGSVLRTFDAYESAFTGGVIVAVADIDGDGRADVITGTDQGGGPRVRVFSGLDNHVVADFLAIDDAAFRGGVRVAAGDVNADGVPDLVAAAGVGGGPRVAVFSGKALRTDTTTRLCPDFFAFESTLRNGVYPAVGKLDADAGADLILGAGPGGAPRVLAVSGAKLLAGDVAAAVAAPIIGFYAGLADDRGGVRVGAYPATGTANILAVGGSGGTATLYNGTTSAPVQTADREQVLASGVMDDISGQKALPAQSSTTSGTTGGTTTGG
ncbi:MAG: VCBS repeat-containing protein [Gemmataceae bacterium]